MRLSASHLWAGWLAAVALAGTPAIGSAQEANPGVEVLARGPVHEAFATTAEFPAPGPIVAKLPPEPVEELPPDQKPAGDDVQWIPGYWQWDDERADFVWVSGFWRVPPPGRIWVAGSWREARGGWQWVAGFWQTAAPAIQPSVPGQAALEYLPPPPAPIELGPSVPAPASTSFYVPGSWVWRGRYVWRPGFWIEHRPGWVWVPSHFRWTPAGYVYIEGYWDLPLAERGVLFAPVMLSPAVVSRPAFVYTPAYVVPPTSMVGAMFVKTGCGSYYFGDYFEPRYTTAGFSAWCGGGRSSGFAISVSVGRAPAPDPLWSYYQFTNRTNPAFATGMHDLYRARYRGEAPRPPRTLNQQNTFVNNTANITNITNNVTNVTNNTINNVTVNAPNGPLATNTMMVAPLTASQHVNPHIAMKPVRTEDRVREQQYARDMRDVGQQRQRVETNLATRGQAPLRATDAPKQAKLDVSERVVARAYAPSRETPPVPSVAAPRTQELRGANPPPQSIPRAVDTARTAVPSMIPPANGDTPRRGPLAPSRVDANPVPPAVKPLPVPPPVKPQSSITPVLHTPKPVPAAVTPTLPTPRPQPVPAPTTPVLPTPRPQPLRPSAPQPAAPTVTLPPVPTPTLSPPAGHKPPKKPLRPGQAEQPAMPPVPTLPLQVPARPATNVSNQPLRPR